MIKQLDNTIKNLEVQLKTETKEEISDLYYLAGLAWYFYPVPTALRDTNIVKYFTSSIHLEKNINFSNIYLGYYYFDNSNYDKALEHFDQVDLDYLNHNDLIWRSANIMDLKIAAELQTRKDNKCIESDLNTLVDYFLEANSKSTFVYPENLISFLSGKSAQKALLPDQAWIAVKLLDLCDKLQCTDVFMEDIENIKKLLK